MREIKFRGKRIDNGEWVYGMPYSFKPFWDTPPYDKPYILMFNPKWDLDAQVNYLRYPKDFSHLKDSIWKVIPESVGQYINKKDKNGKEIYEKDKIRWYPNKPKNHIDEIVEYEDNAFWLGDWYEGDHPDTTKDCKVIGNIIENPELKD